MTRSQKPSDKHILQLFLTDDRGFELEETPSWLQKREAQLKKLEKRNTLALKDHKAERALKPLLSAPCLRLTTSYFIMWRQDLTDRRDNLTLSTPDTPENRKLSRSRSKIVSGIWRGGARKEKCLIIAT